MNKFFTTLSAVALATTMATPVMAQSNHRDHQVLANSIMKAGVNFIVNPNECWEDNSYGWYWAMKNEVVICQENKVQGYIKQVNWTEEDYDTLRHEVHHMVQDCRDGMDGVLSAIYKKPLQLGLEVLGNQGIANVVKAYDHRGPHIVTMEIEAFSVAAMNDVPEQIRDLKKYCM